MFESLGIKIENIDNTTPLTPEEGAVLVEHYVTYYWNMNKYYSLKTEYELEDLINEIYCKFLSKGFFEKYSSKITSKKYYVMHSVNTSLIDLLRKHREAVSLEGELTEDGMCLLDVLPDSTNLEEEVVDRLDLEDVIHDERRRRILEALPDTTDSKIRGFSPLLNCEVNISYRILALHLEAGYTFKMLAEMYLNPKTGNPITQGNVAKHVHNMREYLLDNVVIAY